MALGKDLYDYITKALTLQEQTKKNTSDIKEIRQELRELTATVLRLEFEMQRDREMAAKDRAADVREREDFREILLLRLENKLLRTEQRLPPAPDKLTAGDEP